MAQRRMDSMIAMEQRRPRVMHVLHTLGRGGAERLVHDMIESMRDGYAFSVAALDEGGALHRSLRRLGVPVHVLRRRPGFDARCAARLARLIRRHRVEVTHAHQYTPFVYAAAAKLAIGQPPALLFTEHGRHQPDRRRIKRVIANRVLLGSCADRITAVADAVREALVRYEAMDASRIEVIPNGVSTRQFTERSAQRRLAARQALHVRDDQVVICQVGGFRPVKDHATAVAAMRALHLQRREAVLLLAGDGPTLEPTRRLIEQLRMTHAVRLLGERADVADLWQAADVALCTSRSEGLSVALLEAMASELPVVATAVGGNGQIVLEGRTGLLAPAGDAQAIAAGLRRLIDQPSLRTQYGYAARQHVLAHYSAAAMHRAYAELYDELAGCDERAVRHAA